MLTQYRPSRHQPRWLTTLLFGLMIPAAAVAQTPPPAIAAQTSAATSSWLQRQFAAYEGGNRAAPANAPGELASALARWDWLRRPAPVNARPPLTEQARFLNQYPDWPGTSAMRQRAEAQASDLRRTSDSDARAFFEQIAPQTGPGLARYAMLSSGTQAEKLAHEAWGMLGIGEEQESELLGRFGAKFTAQQHEKRIDLLIWVGQVTAARRLLYWIEGDARKLAEARMALRTNATDADARYNALSASQKRSAGVTHDRALWLERRGRPAEAESLLAAGQTDAGVNAPLTWMRKRLSMGRAAMRRGDHQTAYRILAGHNSYPAGTDLAALPLSERIVLSDTEWLAGWIALRKLNRADDARARFVQFNRAVQSPISQSRGEYWLGRAEQARGDKSAARAAFQRASSFSDYFYGQLAAEELGQGPTLPMVPRTSLSNRDQNLFDARPMAQALQLLTSMGEDSRAALFVRALADSVSTPTEAMAAANLGKRLKRPDLGVWTWKAARARGDLSTFATAYPVLENAGSIPAADWIISHAIARQESSFNTTAISPAGARGLMQLMPATASDVARRLGLPHTLGKLTSDPAYNVRLGSYYIQRRRDDFQNDMLAIAAYNAGAGNVRKWLNAYGDPRRPDVDIIDWVEMIPFEETRNYVQRVTENAVVYSLVNNKRPDAVPRASQWLRR